jgi:hypothetical protein
LVEKATAFALATHKRRTNAFEFGFGSGQGLEFPRFRGQVKVSTKAGELQFQTPPWGGRQEKALFTLDGPGQYDFHVMDFPIEAALHELPLGVHARDAVGIDDDADVFLTISLGEPYSLNDDCYKLAAAVIALD